jgi:hypothetical protein
MSALQRSRVLAALLVTLAVLPAGVAVVDAHAPPTPVCPVCDERLEAAGDRTATYVDVEHSNVTVRVDRDGDARVRSNVTLTDASARRLGNDSDAMRAVVDESFASNPSLWGERLRNVSATLDGSVLVVTYDVPGVARSTRAGGRLVTAFAQVDADYGVNADRFAVYGPSTWSVANRPHTGSVDAAADRESVVWRGDAHEEDRGHLGARTYVAFAPDRAASVGALAAIALDATATHLTHAAVFGAFAAFAVGVVLAGCVAFGDDAYDGDRAVRGLAWGGLTGCVSIPASAVLNGDPLLGTGWFGVIGPFLGIAGFALLLRETRPVESVRQALAFLAATVGTGTVVAVVASGGLVATVALLAAAGVGGAYLLGLVQTGSAKRRVWAGAVVVAAAATLPITPIPLGMGRVFALLFLGFVVVTGMPFAFSAYRAGVATTPSAQSRDTEAGVDAPVADESAK